MADNKNPNFSADDPLDISELASLNDDISLEFIEELQSKLSGDTKEGSSDDNTSFEEPAKIDPNISAKTAAIRFDDNIDDNFIKKYKAKINKQQTGLPDIPKEPEKPKQKEESAKTSVTEPKEIENLSGGNIIEKPAVPEQVEYNDSLDFLDGNTKYSKYVIYIDPENTEFIDSLTVKERKNLINKILREQDDIAITKRRLYLIQTIIKHSIVAILTVCIAIPVIYFVINASLEASINNYRRSQGMFQTLYREKGKIRTQSSYR